MYGEDRATV